MKPTYRENLTKTVRITSPIARGITSKLLECTAPRISCTQGDDLRTFLREIVASLTQVEVPPGMSTWRELKRWATCPIMRVTSTKQPHRDELPLGQVETAGSDEVSSNSLFFSRALLARFLEGPRNQVHRHL